MKTMIEFFSGSKVMSKTFEETGYKTFTIDSNPKLNPDLCINILDFEIDMLPKKFRSPNVIWASPPCTSFSIAAGNHYWKNKKPRIWQTYIGLAIAKKTVELIQDLNPKYYFIENPRGLLAKQDFMQLISKKVVTYCQYGADYRKETHIWTNATQWIPKKCKYGDPCHEYVPHGDTSKGLCKISSAKVRSKIPQELCNEIVAACEGKLKIRQEVLI